MAPRDIIQQMEVPDDRGIFVLGCFERRVTLYSQQVRALNLIHSLFSEERLKEGDHVAIVGGGAAGMTAAAGAAVRGCLVTLLEQADDLLLLFRNTLLRWLHPHIYDWPKPSSTNERAGLPLLDWTAGAAREVADQLLDAWKPLQEQFGITVHRRVQDIRLLPPSSDERVLTWNSPGFERGSFTAVILAVGFGIEKELQGVDFCSYWENDGWDHRWRRPNQPKLHFLVSGTGDGGLVDLLRIRLADLRHERIVNEFLSDPSLEATKTALLDIEDKLQKEQIQSDDLYEHYRALPVPSALDEQLRSRLRQDTSVVLNGLDPVPLSGGACVLNRFLASRMLHLGVPYKAGAILAVQSLGSVDVTFLDLGITERFDKVVVRHGPQPALEQSFKGQWDKAQVHMRKLAKLDQTRTPLWGENDFAWGPQTRPPPGSSPVATFSSVGKSKKDIEVLLAYSREERKRLSKHMNLPIDGGISIPRDCIVPLRAAAESGSLLLTGEPGAGKTGVLLKLAELMEEAPGPVLFLSVERFTGFRIQSDFRAELKLERDLIDLLGAWPGSDPGLLIVDALDASRGGPSEAVIASFIEEAARKLGARWSIVASIRSFDLRNGRRFREVMPGNPPNPDFAEKGLGGVRHFRVPQLSNGELAAVATASPRLHDFHASAPDKLRDLLRNIFNLSLAAELLDAGENPQSIRTAATQSELIRRYEDFRLPSQRLRLAVKAAVSVMVQRRQLTVRATAIENEAVDDVSQAGVLVAAGDSVAFAHHVLFDHMAARFYLSGDDPLALSAQISQGSTLGLMLGPALRFALEDMWAADKEGRPKTWRFLADLAGVATPDPVMLSIAIRTVSELVSALSDVDALRALIESEKKSVAVGRLVGQLARFVGMAAGELGGLRSSAAEAWARVARVAAATKIVRLADAARVLLMTLEERADLSAPMGLNAFGDAARALLNTAWSLSPEHQPLTTVGIRSVARSYGADPEASCALLSRILDERFEEHAPQEAPWLAEGVTSIFRHDPDFVARIYATLYRRDITDDAKTWLGGSPSRIMAMSSTRRQDYQHARWQLNQALGTLLKTDPMAATAVVISTVHALDTSKRNGDGSSLMTIHLRIGDKDIQVIDDLLSLQDWREESSHEEETLSTFVDFLRACPQESFRVAVTAALERPTNAAVWARLFGVAAERPGVADDMLWPVAADPHLTVLQGLSRDAVIFLAGAYPQQPPEHRKAFEMVALAQDLFIGEREARLWDSVLKRLLSVVPAELIVTPEMRMRRSNLDASNELTGNPPFLNIECGWEDSDDIVQDLLRSQGVDLERNPDRELHAASRKLEDRLKQNAEDADFLACLWADILGVVELLDNGASQQPHPKLVHSTWGAVSNGVERLAKSIDYSPDAEKLPDLEHLIALIDRLMASPYPDGTDSSSSDMSWGNWDVRVYAASSLVALSPRFAGKRPDIVDRMGACLRDPTPTVRLQVARSLTVLWDVDRERMWSLAADVANRETHRGVLRFFAADSMQSLSSTEPERCAELLDQMLQRKWALGGDAQNSSHHADDHAIARLAAFLYVARSQTLAWKWVERWSSDLRRGGDYIAPILQDLRQVFFFRYLNEPKPEQLEMAMRARKLLDLVVGAATDALQEARSHLLVGTPSQEEVDTWRPLYEVGDRVMDEVSNLFYFGSGAFEPPGERAPKSSLLSSEAKRRFLAEQSPILDTIAVHAQARTVHSLIKLLAYLVDGDPSGVFDRIAKLLLGPSAADGYHFEALGMDSLGRLIRLYLADHRKIFFEDTTRLQTLVAVLDLFSSAGWPEALKVLFELPDLLR